MSNQYQVKKSASLLDFLLIKLDGMSRNKVKLRLKNGCVAVNGVTVSKANSVLEVGDAVVVSAIGKGPVAGSASLPILFQDVGLVAINKPAGLLSVASAQEGPRHALGLLRTQLTKGTRRAGWLGPVHRLDRDTSGVLLFATTREAHMAVTARWTEAKKFYLAIVEGRPKERAGTIDQPLRMDQRDNRAVVGAHPEAKHAVTHFETLSSTKRRSLLKVQIETGRQHQIRAHLTWLGHPVVGDRIYGYGDQRMGLHALRLEIPSPRNGETLVFEVDPPPEFSALLN